MSGEREVSVTIRAKDAVAGGLASSKAKISEWAGSISSLVTGALAGLSIGAFFTRAADEVSGAQRAVAQLDNTLANLGIDFKKIRPDLDAAIASLQKVAAVDDDDAVNAFNTLVQVSGDYRGSLKNLGLVLDVAAAKQISLEEAATRVAKIMSGTGAKALKEFGIATKDPIEGIEQLRAKVKGAAEAELLTLEGSTKAANIAFGDFAQSVGEAVAESSAFQSVSRFIIDSLGKMATGAKENKSAIAAILATVVAFVIEVAKAIDALVSVGVYGYQALQAAGDAVVNVFNPEKRAEAVRMLSASMENLHGVTFSISDAWDNVATAAAKAETVQVTGLKRTREELAKNKAAHDALLAAQKAAADDAEFKAYLKTLPKNKLREAIEDRNRKTDKFNEQFDGGLRASDNGRDLTGTRERGARALDANAIDADVAKTGRELNLGAIQRPDLDFGQQLGLKLKETVGEGTNALLELGDVLADVTSGPMLAFGDAIEASMSALVSGSMSAGKAFMSVMVNAVKGVAAAKGKLFAGESLAALAGGFLGHPGAFAAAAKYGAAAALMFTLAGAAGGLTSSGGGGSGGNSTTSASQATQSSLADVGRGKTTVVLQGRRMMLDMYDPADRKELGDFIKDLVGTREVDFVFQGDA